MNIKEKGVSLVSLMIASAIGIVLVAGISTVFVNSHSTYRVRDAIALSHENARFSIQDLQRYLVLAGRGMTPNPNNYNTDNDNGERTFPQYSSTGTAANTEGIVNIDNNGSSILAFRYASGPAPCGGDGTISATTTVRFYINTKNELVCQQLGSFQRPIVSGIIRMRALYGIDTDSTGSANQYLEASAVESLNHWDKIVAIRVGILASSGELTLPSTFRPPQIETMALLGTDYTLPDTARSYKSSKTTVLLRNLNKTVERQ